MTMSAVAHACPRPVNGTSATSTSRWRSVLASAAPSPYASMTRTLISRRRWMLSMARSGQPMTATVALLGRAEATLLGVSSLLSSSTKPMAALRASVAINTLLAIAHREPARGWWCNMRRQALTNSAGSPHNEPNASAASRAKAN